MCGAARRPWVRDGPACSARAAPPPVTAAARAPPCTNREAAPCPGSSRREGSCHDTRQQESSGRRVIDQQTAPAAARVSRYTSLQGLREGAALVAVLLVWSLFGLHHPDLVHWFTFFRPPPKSCIRFTFFLLNLIRYTFHFVSPSPPAALPSHTLLLGLPDSPVPYTCALLSCQTRKHPGQDLANSVSVSLPEDKENFHLAFLPSPLLIQILVLKVPAATVVVVLMIR